MHKHTAKVLLNITIDAAVLAVAMVYGMLVMTPVDWDMKLLLSWPSIIVGALAVGSSSYVMGLYSGPSHFHKSAVKEILVVAIVVGICLTTSVLAMTIFGYLNFSTRIGRGTMLVGALAGYALIIARHLYMRRNIVIDNRVRVALIITSAKGEAQAAILNAVNQRHIQIVGVFVADHVPSTIDAPILGTLDDIREKMQSIQIDEVICPDEDINDPRFASYLCTLRYSGTPVSTLLGLCEDMFQCIPAQLVTTNWLLSASASPHLRYIKNVKRMFDVVVALIGLLLLWPLLLVGMLLVKLTSPGAVIYRQHRCGRFGVEFEVYKLRTMRMDAEANGAVWSQENDPRVTPVGRFLRKYRIDEIPQLLNVLRGEMSFVGPRPERPEFISDLSKEIPFYRERLLILPGVTGWAQVRYPYGSTVADARRKLEYDLYYMKHMGLLLDLLILLDTVRTVVKGDFWSSTGVDLNEHLEPKVSQHEAKAPSDEALDHAK